MPPRGLSLYKMQDGGAGGLGLGGSLMQPSAPGGLGLGGSLFNTPIAQSGGGGLDDILAAILGGESGALGGSSSSQSTGSTVVLPPVVELLQEMRARRESAVAQAETLASIMSNNLPSGMMYYPGFERGGLADVLLGIITGKGPAAAQQILPQGQRMVDRVNLNVPSSQPGVGDEFGQGMTFADAIMAAIRNIQTSQSSSQSSSGGG